MKLKTRKAVAKRLKLTATGKVKFKRAGLRHNTGLKRASNKLKLRHSAIASASDSGHVERCLPYGSK